MTGENLDEKARLLAMVAAAEADVRNLRAEKKRTSLELAASGGTEHARDLPIQGRLAQAKERLAEAERALKVFEKTGGEYGVVADADGNVFGSVAVAIPPGTPAVARQEAIEAALDGHLGALARELGVVLAARPFNYTREKPGRDAERRVVLVIEGRVEGDRLVPSVSWATKRRRGE